MTSKRDHANLLAQFDQQERIDAEFPGTDKKTLPNLVRFVRPGPGTNFIVYSRLDPPTANLVIRAQIEDMQAFEGDFEWKVYRHDRPPDLGDRLEAQGFERDDPAPVLVLDLAHAPSSLEISREVDVKRLESLSEFDQVASVEA
jgi:hypothetical protein